MSTGTSAFKLLLDVCRARMSAEAAASTVLEVIQTILERILQAKQARNFTLIGLTLLQDREEAGICCNMFALQDE